MHALLEEARQQNNIAGIKLCNFVFEHRDKADQWIPILEEIDLAFQNGTDESHAFTRRIYACYLDYTLKQLRLKLGDFFMESPRNFEGMHESLEYFIQKVRSALDTKLLSEDALRQTMTAIHTIQIAIHQREMQQCREDQFRQSDKNGYMVADPIRIQQASGVFYLRDAQAKQFLKDQGAQVTTLPNHQIKIEGLFGVPADIGLKIKATRAP